MRRVLKIKMENKKIKTNINIEKQDCKDPKCPIHGGLKVRGRIFRGAIIKKFNKRIVIEFERTVFIRKYERYAKLRTKLHARLPDCLEKTVEVGDYVEIHECRPLSKIIKFVMTQIIRKKNNMENKK